MKSLRSYETIRGDRIRIKDTGLGAAIDGKDCESPPTDKWTVFDGKKKGVGPPPRLIYDDPRPYWRRPPYWPVVTPPADFCLDEAGVRKTFPQSDDYMRTVFMFRPPSLSRYATLTHVLQNLKAPTAEAAVTALFLAGLSGVQRSQFKVVRVDAVVSASAYHVYDAMRSAAERRLGKSRAREAWLWHGTAEENLSKICVNGFDRSFGKVAMYGHGVYFARDSGYSAVPRYSKPNADGLQRMLLCRVLVCEACVGQQSYTAPRPKPFPRMHENYESFVDDLRAPSVFVSTRDFQAYPEFLVTFARIPGSRKMTKNSAKLKIGVEVPVQPSSS
eukprot:g3490.t1